MSTQHVQQVLLFLALEVNSQWFQTLRSYTLFIEPPFLCALVLSYIGIYSLLGYTDFYGVHINLPYMDTY